MIEPPPAGNCRGCTGALDAAVVCGQSRKDTLTSSVDQPSSLAEPIAQAEAVAATISTDDEPMGSSGKPFNWRAPFFVGAVATAG